MATSTFWPLFGLLLFGLSALSCYLGSAAQRLLSETAIAACQRWPGVPGWGLGSLLWLAGLCCWLTTVNLLAALCTAISLWSVAALLLVFVVPLIKRQPTTKRYQPRSAREQAHE